MIIILILTIITLMSPFIHGHLNLSHDFDESFYP